MLVGGSGTASRIRKENDVSPGCPREEFIARWGRLAGVVRSVRGPESSAWTCRVLKVRRGNGK